MKKGLRIISLLLAAAIAVTVASCSPVDEDYNTQKEDEMSSQNKYDSVPIPEVASEDEVMPTYLDITLYDVENYADIYLGKKYEFKFTYSGTEIEVPSTYKKMTSKGWKLVETDECSTESIILANKYMKAQFENEYGKQITALFYNASKSSVTLKKCKIVKFIVSENILEMPESVYGQFFINGISNESAITDVVNYLGAPSHFYRESENRYYLDYFISKEDKRSGITVYVDVTEDTVTAIEIADYR